VVLPQPEGPSSAKKLAGENVERDLLDRGRATESFAHAIEAHERFGGRLSPRRESSPRAPPLLMVARIGAVPHRATLTAHGALLNLRRAGAAAWDGGLLQSSARIGDRRPTSAAVRNL